MARSTAAPATDQWEQLSFRLVWPEQRRYETIRPIVLFGDAAEHQARRTGTPIRTLYHRVKQFDRQGIKGLLEAEAPHGGSMSIRRKTALALKSVTFQHMNTS